MSSVDGGSGMVYNAIRPIGPETLSPGAEKALQDEQMAHDGGCMNGRRITVTPVTPPLPTENDRREDDEAPGNNEMELRGRKDDEDAADNAGDDAGDFAVEDVKGEEVEIIAVTRFTGRRDDRIEPTNGQRRSAIRQEHDNRGLKRRMDEKSGMELLGRPVPWTMHKTPCP